MNSKHAANVLIAASLIVAGCVSHDSTTAERAASFAPYANAHIGPTPVAEFLRQRSAPLAIFSYDGAGSGYATAIDRRGYYLTAAHCVQHATVGFMQGSQFQPAEVVWYGDPDKPGSDLAILYVDSPPREVFEWATEVGKSDAVFGIGRNHDGPSILSTLLFQSTKPPSPETYGDFVAGKILDLPGKPAVPLRASRFLDDAPVHPGDSGGPLVAADGRLIAINYAAVDYEVWGLGPVEVAAAYRPDLAWLGQIIDADSAMRAAEAKGDVDGEITAAGRVLDFDPNNVAALNRRGQLEDRKGDHDAAIADADRATAVDPANLEALCNRGNAEKGKHDYDQAIASYTAALAIDPFDINSSSRVNRGDAYLAKGDFRDAIYDDTLALLWHPKNSDLFAHRNITKSAADDFEQVIADFTRAIELWPKNANYLVIRGTAKLALDDHPGAASDFEAAVQLEPTNSEALFWRGVERKIRGDLEGTLADWEQSIAADPANSSRTRLYRALILTQNGKPDAELAQEVDGWKDGSLKAIGQFVVGRTDETALLAAVGKATDQPALGAQGEVYYCIGVMRLVHGNAAGAQEFFQKSVATGLRSSFARQFARAELTRLGHATAFSPPAP